MDTTGPLRRVRAFDRRHPLSWDVALACGVGSVSANASGDLHPPGVALLVVVHGALVLRRRRPLPALVAAASAVVVGAVAAVLTGTAVPWAYLAVWVLLFHVGLRDGGLRERARFAVVGLVVGLVTLTSAVSPAGAGASGAIDTEERVRASVAVLAMCAASFLLGLQIRGRREQLAAQREEAARAAVVAERSRIAQEMHDIIGHNLSVITSLATGGAVAVRNAPDDAAAAFDAIGAVSRSSVRDVRRVLAVLRHDRSAEGAALSPQPGLREIPELVEAVRAAGLPVTLSRVGSLRQLSAGRQLAVHRIVQESLTNVLRHAAAGSRVGVAIRRDGADVVVRVDDVGPAGADPGGRTPAGVPGQGILGMRERAETYGGTLEAGPVRGGWSVVARIGADGNDGESEEPRR
ncbi:histidine kinase [Myceligenerans pegani]|uniref:histidine kinase n=1 Tax=Myceligenerans pegani TaxID=2776917 RepID=A0ABR9N4D7_9MICO|nr:histidine kinase [Myceligenerans sp. TRM 65318]MBE1878200.1 sensor histidine kinase [Myceligenerans sp. TRM 65318]MBE3020471.1 sensor histidine kinase [Myceligenerans sp. TRM 65318]